MRKWSASYKKRASGGFVSLFNFAKGASRTGSRSTTSN
ncbi:hypothetical protein HMPREF1321_0597 [Capnocytophaga sp. oral taxon 412 str. F0487]|nr:hypothetical protein HMPREF1321_0597 [Capnocytophaga sp. oral taxon 412 str. F0487]EJF43187.1 hypothetical protein HMPREF1319_1919 [Capnocytophaga ochracea str. Holt 25]